MRVKHNWSHEKVQLVSELHLQITIILTQTQNRDILSPQRRLGLRWCQSQRRSHQCSRLYLKRMAISWSNLKILSTYLINNNQTAIIIRVIQNRSITAILIQTGQIFMAKTVILSRSTQVQGTAPTVWRQMSSTRVQGHYHKVSLLAMEHLVSQNHLQSISRELREILTSMRFS